jgi:hypothetical protein
MLMFMRDMRDCRANPILVTMADMGNALASVLAPLAALDERGAPVALGDLWRSRPVVLAFVRHFG